MALLPKILTPSSKSSVALLDYGAGNLRSLANALKAIGAAVTDNLDEATHLILPGVGSFPYGMKELEKRGFVDLIEQTKKPLLGICLGMQLLSQGSDEDAPLGTPGLRLLPGWVRQLPVPHVGWDSWEGADYYFTHHYMNQELPYAVKGDRLWACQFHPEKSQGAGLQFLKDFLSL